MDEADIILIQMMETHEAKLKTKRLKFIYDQVLEFTMLLKTKPEVKCLFHQKDEAAY